MDTADSTSDELLVRGKSGQDLQEMLREVGLAVEYWLPKLQEHLGVTCAQALQHIQEEHLQKLKSQAQHPWEKRALEKLLNSNRLSKLQESQVKMRKEQQKKAEQAPQGLRDLQSEGRKGQEEAGRIKEAELRQAMEIPKECWPLPEKSLREVMKHVQGQLNPMEATLSHRQNLPDRDLVRWASGGLALQGIYKTSYQKDLVQKREELLSVPKELLFLGPGHSTWMETREFTSSQEESKFTQMTEKLGFSVIASAKGGGWGFSVEAGMDHSKHSESKENQQSHSEHSYFCSTKFSYVPLASCHFPMDQLQFSKAALQELKCIEDLLSQSADTDRLPVLRRSTEAFFHRFGSHANQGPLHLGGIYWWKAISEGFRSEQLAQVKQQSAEALNGYIRGSYSCFSVKVAAGVDESHSHSETSIQSPTFQNLQTKVQLSVAQTGGPPEANGFLQWKAGLVANNQTWSVIDRGLQLVPIWDIILSNHRSDFKDTCQVASLLKDSYTALTGITAQIQDGEELLSAEEEAGVSLEDVKSWEVSDPEEQLQKLINFMQILSQKTNSYDTWVNKCLTNLGLQNFLVKTVNFCKQSSIYETKFIKSQLCSLLDPHIHRVNDFPQAHSILQWVFQAKSVQEHINISQFSQLNTSLKKIKNDLMEAMVISKSDETEAQRKATYEVSLSLRCFLNYLQETEQPDTQLLLLSIAAGAGYHVVNKHFQYLLGVGNGFSASKSQIMNCLLSKRKHDVFFHRHCRGSTKDCLLMGGVVEICWFCPGGDDEDRFDNCVTFTNLHGDAKEHKKQLTFLQEVSSLIVVLMSTSDDNNENQKIIRDLSQSLRPLIYLVDNKERNMDNNSSQKVVIGIRNRNEAELTEELVSTIRRLLELSDTALSLEDCTPIARKQGFLIDEDQQDCREAKEKAEVLMALLRKLKISQVKENLLPLQGHLWHCWCKKDKELYHLREKGNRSIEQHKSEIETEKQRIRNQQLTRAFPLNELMQSVLEILQNHSETQTTHYFLQWMSVFLDNLTAGHLEKLSEKKNNLWSRIQTEKQKAPKSTHLQKGIEAISKEISDCTLGIEQFLREVGQIYEALEETYLTKNTLYLSLPQIAADLMISGAPIELMDGDASYVPVKWVAALFDKVSEKLGNKRLFVLSVLGLQSSGKSTLLNALFGLQFTVSAGRCTRGAYMQLLKVEDTFTEELGFDFVLVVDTEGLRAPELSNKSKNRDNELATFVIGLGNLTLINIFGENPSEMQDILQIVVQAFMRMKQVKISPSCLFVHQNVGEVTAKDQTMEGRRRLEQRLDEMATAAAEQEQCSDVTRFGDIIKFDVNTDVFYFAHLWDGNPPMAPPNPRYSHNVQDLKSRILMVAKQESRGSIMKFSDVKLRVQDLWRALLSENFIFRFRNTQEVVSMSKLEDMYHSWTWQLRSYMLDLQNQLINQIKNGKIQELKASTLQAPVTEKYEAIQQELEKYFKEDPDSEIIIQWKAIFETKLVNLKESLIFETKKRAEEHICYKKNQEILDNKMSSYEKELLVKSVDLALTLKDKVLSENELHARFNDLWKNWVSGVSSTFSSVPEPEIEVDGEGILLEHFKKETNMSNRVKEKSRKKFEVNCEEHVTMSKRFGLLTRSIEVHDEESIKETTDHIISRYTENFKNLQRQQCDYDPSYFHQILNIIEEEVKSEATKDRYTFTNKYKIDLSLYLFQRAYENFKEMHRAFKKTNDPVSYLESKKDDFLMGFKISCQGATSVIEFVDFLWHKLTPAVHDTISEKMAPKIAGDMIATCPAFSGNRANLEKHVLISLAEKENFDDYWKYIQNPKSFFKNYIQNHTKIYCSEQNNKIKTFLGKIIHSIKNAILSAIHESTAIAKDKSSTVSGWLDLFCDHLGNNLNFPRKYLVSIQHQEIKDIELLKEAMNKALDELMIVVEKTRFSMPEEDMILEIQSMLSEHLCGCWKQCPFCGAICTNTIPNHDGDHSVPFHRPKAVAGGQWVNTNHFNIDCCTSLVASNYSFVLNGRNIPFKTYRQAGGELAKWSITPDTSPQPYWKWFVCHFRSNLEEKYEKKFTDKGKIPNAWTKITKQNVLDDLKK
ncbi:PREDICTED: interferon-induced very large GTPase 1 [Myotis davidii]|uniref:interferon-induced very large GTPase 1 n=1 Tax=Myotis davidii TaxID=225400 RepID=UPI0007673F3B|nr:PREDICTED: interferon-induced very large GTPase 1 [Myotis davidii]